MIRFKKLSLNQKSFSTFVIFNLITSIVLLVGGFLCLKNALLRKDLDSAQLLAGKINYAIEEIFKSASYELELVASHPAFKNNDLSDGSKQVELQKLLLLMKKFEQISILDLKGNVKYSTNYNYVGNLKHSDFFMRTLIEKRTQISTAYYTPNPRHLVFSFSTPIFNADKDVIAVLCAQLNFNKISSFFANTYFGEDGYSMLIDHFSRVLAGGNKDDVLMPVSDDLRRKIEGLKEDLTYIDDNSRYVSLYRGEQFIIFISRSHNQVFGVMKESYDRMMIFTIVVIITSFTLGFNIYKLIFRNS